MNKFLIMLLVNLINFATITDDKEANVKALHWVQEQVNYPELNFQYHEFNGHPALTITTQKTMHPKVWLVAHMDVVPASADLFQPIVKEGKMYGRGAYDMKMAIASYMTLLRDLKGSLGKYDFGIMLTSDEEQGGMNGVKKLLELGYSSDVALLPDGGFNWNFENQAKGVLQIKVGAHGKSGHSSRPWEGKNAIDQLIPVVMEIEKQFKKPSPNDYEATVNVGLISGGKSVNQIPDYAEAELDIRFPPSQTVDQIYKKMSLVVSQYEQVTIEKMKTGSAYKADISNEYFQKFKNRAKDLYGIEMGTVSSYGASDARFFGEKNIPTLVIAPKGGEIHSSGEWVDLEDLSRFYQVMKAWVMDISRIEEN